MSKNIFTELEKVMNGSLDEKHKNGGWTGIRMAPWVISETPPVDGEVGFQLEDGTWRVTQPTWTYKDGEVVLYIEGKEFKRGKLVEELEFEGAEDEQGN